MDIVRSKRPLFVGIGGGNDIFSTMFAAVSLWRQGWRWDRCSLAGVLSPFHKYGNLEETRIPGWFRTRANSKRFLSRYDNGRRISFIDSAVSALVARGNHYGIEGVYGLSLEAGSGGVDRAFRQLVEKFDYFVLVDIGGDVLYDGDPAEDHILSPMFDAMVLRGFRDSQVPGLLFEAGPGTDGELSPKCLRRVLASVSKAEYPVDEHVITWWERLWQEHIRGARPGRTVPMTCQAFRAKAGPISIDYRARNHLGSRRYYGYFRQLIDTDLCKKFWLIEPAKISNPYAVRCGGPLTWFEKTQLPRTSQLAGHGNNECNLEYLDWYGQLWQFLTPSPLLSDVDRAVLLDTALTEAATGQVCDGLRLLPADWQAVGDVWLDQFDVDFGLGGLVELVPKIRYQ